MCERRRCVRWRRGNDPAFPQQLLINCFYFCVQLTNMSSWRCLQCLRVLTHRHTHTQTLFHGPIMVSTHTACVNRRRGEWGGEGEGMWWMASGSLSLSLSSLLLSVPHHCISSHPLFLPSLFLPCIHFSPLFFSFFLSLIHSSHSHAH